MQYSGLSGCLLSFPARHDTVNNPFLAMCWLLVVKSQYNSKCRVSGLSELQDLIKEMQISLGWEPEMSNRLRSNMDQLRKCTNSHTCTHTHVYTLRWSRVMTFTNISSNFICLSCQAAANKWNWGWECAHLLLPNQWTCICHNFI